MLTQETEIPAQGSMPAVPTGDSALELDPAARPRHTMPCHRASYLKEPNGSISTAGAFVLAAPLPVLAPLAPLEPGAIMCPIP